MDGSVFVKLKLTKRKKMFKIDRLLKNFQDIKFKDTKNSLIKKKKQISLYLNNLAYKKRKSRTDTCDRKDFYERHVKSYSTKYIINLR